MDAPLHACFGFEFIGMCKYDPNSPTPTYFTIGDALATLAFTFAVQQFLKPINRLRLSSLGLSFSYVVIAVFFGASLSVIAATVPNIPLLNGTIFSYPINWEIAGAIIIGSSYALVALISLRPTKINERNVKNFCMAGAQMMSEATDEERSILAKELFDHGNLLTLIKITGEFQRGEHHAMQVEIEKLKAQEEMPLTIRGRPRISAFYAFSRRHQLEKASYAAQFLQILSDPDFCRVIITRHSWDFLRSISHITDVGAEVEHSKAFVQEVIKQAVEQNDGMLAKEDDFVGFGRHRHFSRELFENPKILNLDLLNGVHAYYDTPIDPNFISRLNNISERLLKNELEHSGFWYSKNTSTISKIYTDIFRSILFNKETGKQPKVIANLSIGISRILEITNTALDNLSEDQYQSLYIKNSDLKNHTNNAVSEIAEIIIEAFCSISNDFQGPTDPRWPFAINLFIEVFERDKCEETGLSPLQQIVAIKIIDKLKENMIGYYPTISRILISVIGPHNEQSKDTTRTANNIIRDAVYFELKALPKLYARDENKAIDRLPPYVVYENKNSSLVFTYPNGQKTAVNLDEIAIDFNDLINEGNRRIRRKNSVGENKR